MAVRSIIESSRWGPSSVVQNPDQKDFTFNTENTLPMSIFSQRDLNVDHDRNYETRNVENIEYGDLPALKPNYGWRAHAHQRLACRIEFINKVIIQSKLTRLDSQMT